jgi:hypothetical protein
MTLRAVPPNTASDRDTGEALANDLYDLIAERLPRIPMDDPAREVFARHLPAVGDALGRPRALLIEGDI